MAIKTYNDVDEVSSAAADWIVHYLRERLLQKEKATVVLSGGNTPKKLYALLASEKYKNEIDWQKLIFFWGDERHVPFTDQRNNASMAIDTLLSKVGVAEEQIIRMNTNLPPEAAAVDYEEKLNLFFAEGVQTFDLVLLGMGDNAHTLSLFPGYDNIYEKEKKVFSFYLEEQSEFRITLSASIVNAAAQIVFLIAGKDKALPLKEAIFGAYNPDRLPVQLIKQDRGDIIWLLDKAAANEITQNISIEK